MDSEDVFTHFERHLWTRIGRENTAPVTGPNTMVFGPPGSNPKFDVIFTTKKCIFLIFLQ